MKPICFSIMPFDQSFDDINTIVRDAAERCGMEYVRGDQRNQPGSVLAQIVRDIERASVVVVDITGANPNVFYELGIAHHGNGPEQIVIITQSNVDSPYDVQEFRHLRYTHSKDGRQKLADELPEALHAALNSAPEREHWSVIRGRTQRTKVIIRDLGRLIDKYVGTSNKKSPLEGVVIRSVAGLSSFSISDHEPPDDREGSDYDNFLRLERDTLRRALLMGATFRSLINPPRVFAKKMLPGRLSARYRRLIGLLQGQSDSLDVNEAAADCDAMKQCEWALNPVPMPNLLIIGNDVAYEGFKQGGRRGFARTHCETDPVAIAALIEDFDSHFEDCFNSMNAPDLLANELQSMLEHAEAHDVGRQ